MKRLFVELTVYWSLNCCFVAAIRGGTNASNEALRRVFTFETYPQDHNLVLGGYYVCDHADFFSALFGDLFLKY